MNSKNYKILKHEDYVLLKSLYEEIALAHNEIIYNTSNFLVQKNISKDVLGIYVYIKYMLDNLFLTFDKMLEYPIPEYESKMEGKYFHLYDSSMLLPAGFDLCRHRANFLYWVYSNLGYENSELFVYDPSFTIDYDLNDNKFDLNQINYLINLLISRIVSNDDNKLKYVETIDGITIELVRETIPDEDDKKRGNHIVNMIVGLDKELYLLDASNEKIASKDENISPLVDNAKIYPFNKEGFCLPVYPRWPEIYNPRLCGGLFSNGPLILARYAPLPIDEQLLKVREFEEKCGHMSSEFEEFKKQNLEYYKTIYEDVKRLVKISNL